MNSIINFLTSSEVLIILTIAGISCLLCIIIYMIDNNKDKRRKKHNTKVLNEIVEQVYEQTDEYERSNYDYNKVPVLETIDSVHYNYDNENVLNNIAPSKEQIQYEETPSGQSIGFSKISENSELEEMLSNTETIKVVEQEEAKEEKTNPIIQEIRVLKDDDFEEEEETIKIEEELQYTSIEPTKEEAKRQIEELTEKLQLDELKKEEFFNEPEEAEKPIIEEVSDNIKLTSYEEKQEEDAIISLEELTKKSKELTEANELTQYADEGNEPISLQDLEQRMSKQMQEVEEDFEIEKVADKVSQEEIDDMLDGTMPIKTEEINNRIKMDDFNTIKTTVVKEYHPTPIISPIYGIEQEPKTTDMELENTAEYKKMDEEIKKTNEFIMSLKELQKHLD